MPVYSGFLRDLSVMDNRPRIKGRQTLRLNGYDYSIPGLYFVTICTYNKKSLFGNVIEGEMVLNRIGRIVNEEWIKAGKSRDDIGLDEWVLMPNHLHGIVDIKEDAVGIIPEVSQSVNLCTKTPHLTADIFSRAAYEFPLNVDVCQRRNMILPRFIGKFKMLSAKRVNHLRKTSGEKLWQKSYWDRIIRDERDLNRIRQYIKDNPSQWRKDRFYWE